MKKVLTVLMLATSMCGYFSTSNAQRFDVEVDPIAYMFNGYSVHGGYLWDSFRLDVGVFGIDIPEAVHGNEGFKSRIDGFGAKLDYYVFRPQRGLLVGLESGVVRAKVEWSETGDDTSRIQYSVGVRSGYRFLIADRITVTPWLGLGYTLNAANQHIAGRTYETSAFQPFPTVHLGYTF